MICEYCGKEIGEGAKICPHCGALRSSAQTQQPSTSYGPFPAPADMPPLYQQGYKLQQPEGHTSYHQYAFPGQAAPPPYQSVPLPAPPGSLFGLSTENTGAITHALTIEIILSLFGIFGVGWIMAGKTTPGIILVVCSFFIYWPFMLLGTAFTLGIGLIFLGPLAIGAIIVNALLLNAALKRSQHLSTMQQQATYYRQMPPQ